MNVSRTPAGVRTIEGRQRVIIEAVDPQIDCGDYPIKRIDGDPVRVAAVIVADGHDLLAAALLHRGPDDEVWTEIPMRLGENDRWETTFVPRGIGAHRYTVAAWVDRFGSWRSDLAKKMEAGQDVSIELLGGADLVEAAARRAPRADAAKLHEWAKVMRSAAESSLRVWPDDELAALMERHAERPFPVRYARDLEVWVEREAARFSSWYELFPRSWSADPGRAGTLADVRERGLPYAAGLGFDVLYLPPIHPIGHTNRKGPNNATDSNAHDPGSPWAIGNEDGGHTAIDPALGTVEDFEALLDAARARGMEVALDLAFQCSPDHPYVKEHPEWFRHRADGSIQYAENPPKKYQDIYPIDFETTNWRELWEELRGVVDTWIARGVRIFRVDNPHTKSFRFWRWLIDGVKATHPDVIFLSEAFTRPAVMYHLAKIGFTQSYTYFTWRTAKHELIEYFTELTTPPVRDFFRPHLWPNTPDILPFHLQETGRPSFVARLVLATTLGTSYGIYGPAFELGECTPLAEGREEYRDSEKYEIREWRLDDPASLAPLVAQLNAIRRSEPALQRTDHLRFERIENDMLIAYSRADADRSNVILVVVNLDPNWRQSGWLELADDLGIPADRPYVAHDLVTRAKFMWYGLRNYIELDPSAMPAHVLRIEAHGEPF